MKKVFAFALLAVVGIYVTGQLTLGEAGAMHFVREMDSLMNDGKAEDVCAMLHDDLEMHIEDHTSEVARNLDGGKDELCELTHDAVNALKSLPRTMRVEFNDVTVKRDWLHPWTSEVSYTEDRILTIRGTSIRISTTSEDVITLVQTFSGVKLRKLKAETYVNE
jgi:hypothetical protein